MAETASAVLNELESFGTAQNRKVYARHGANEPMFGVSFANLNNIAKRIKTNAELARGLWASGNMDARTLATIIADPAVMTEQEMNQWAEDIDYSAVGDYFVNKLALHSPHVEELMRRWCKSKKEFVIRCGYHLLGQLAKAKAERPDSFFLPYLKRIEAGIHGAPNRGREGMLNALIAIGKRNETLQISALETAKRIGPVEVDHGQTSCKTPDAVAKLS